MGTHSVLVSIVVTVTLTVGWKIVHQIILLSVKMCVKWSVQTVMLPNKIVWYMRKEWIVIFASNIINNRLVMLWIFKFLIFLFYYVAVTTFLIYLYINNAINFFELNVFSSSSSLNKHSYDVIIGAFSSCV